MTYRRLLPLFSVSLFAFAACGGEVAVADEVKEVGGASKVEAPQLPAGPPDGVALIFDDEALLERIRVSDGEARFIARGELPDGRLVSATFAEEGGRLVYAYDLEVAGVPGVTRVVVDTLNARVVRSGPEADPAT